MRVQWWWHILLTCTFLMLPFLMGPHPFEEGQPWFRPGTQREMFVHVFLVLFFYLHYYILLPKLFFPKRYGSYTAVLVTGFAIVIVLPEVLRALDLICNPSNVPATGKFPARPWQLTEMTRHVFLFVTTILLGLFIKLNDRLRVTRHEKTQAELSYLKAQVNPHFLFNTLNTIYSLSLTKSERTPDAVVQLSNMMRHVLMDAQTEFVELSKEIEYIRNYISLQRLRLDDAVKLHFEVTGEPGGRRIAPLLLIPFIENAFKYGVNPEEDSEITIRIDVRVEELLLDVRNSVVKVQIPDEDRTGLGLVNTRERLAMQYPGKHHLTINNDGRHYEVRLQITLS